MAGQGIRKNHKNVRKQSDLPFHSGMATPLQMLFPMKWLVQAQVRLLLRADIFGKDTENESYWDANSMHPRLCEVNEINLTLPCFLCLCSPH